MWIGLGWGRLHSVFSSSTAAAASSGSSEDQRFQLKEMQSLTVDPESWVLNVKHSPTSPSWLSLRYQQQQTQLHVVADDDDDQHQHIPELTPFFPTNIIHPLSCCYLRFAAVVVLSEHTHTHMNGAITCEWTRYTRPSTYVIDHPIIRSRS